MTTSFNKEKHEYLIDGKRATGVTTIIGVLSKGDALLNWAARMAVEYIRENASEQYEGIKCLCSQKEPHTKYEVCEVLLEEARTAHTKKKEAAGTHGTDAHALVESVINVWLEELAGKPPVDFLDLTTTQKYKAIEPFIKWAQENVDHFLFSERQMFNKELFIAGTADFAYVGKDGKKYMADFKTSSGIYGIDYWLQVAAYRFLAEAEGDTPYDGATVVRLGKKGPEDFEVLHRYDYDTDKEAFLACLTLYRAQATYTKPNK